MGLQNGRNTGPSEGGGSDPRVGFSGEDNKQKYDEVDNRGVGRTLMVGIRLVRVVNLIFSFQQIFLLM